VIMERGVRDLSSFLKDRAKRKDLRISTLEAFWRDMVEAVNAIHSQGAFFKQWGSALEAVKAINEIIFIIFYIENPIIATSEEEPLIKKASNAAL
jgi:hypothetical protein